MTREETEEILKNTLLCNYSLYPTEEEPYWHKGIPAENGWYLCIEEGQYIPYMLRSVFPSVDKDDEFENVIVWHKIPDYKEEEQK